MKLRTAFAVAALLALAPAGAGTAAAGGVSVGVDRTAISTALGRKFVFETTISNHGSAPVRNLIAHLNVLSLRNGTYIDPEDWSSHRTRYLAPIPGRGSVKLTWRLQAVNSGDIGVYVAVLPARGGPRSPTVGPTVHVSIAHRRMLDSGGILPLALGIPALLALLATAVRRVRRSDRRPRPA